MGLIREPKNVDFYVLDKPWTDKERKEFSAFIKLRKEQQKNEAQLFQQKKEERLSHKSYYFFIYNHITV